MGVSTYVPVPEFYAGKSVFITGGAGFLGKVLLEKLLYSCPNVDKIYLLLRDKKNVNAQQRLHTIINLPLFSRLRKERPQDLDKIVVLKGDIGAQNLNMKTEDLETVIEKVSVVIHSAASVKFNDPLKISLNINLEGTRNVLNLCHLIKNLQVFIHISTVYCNSDKKVIEELVYPPPVSEEEAFRFVDKWGKNKAETTKFLKGNPNSYTFTKALAEHLVAETHGDIPAVIIRPSIVTPSIDEPVKGWVDNWYGATAGLTALAKGVLRAVYTTDDHVLDLMPVDYVCNLTLVAGARAKRQAEVAVYNSCSGSTNPITMKEVLSLYVESSIKCKFNNLPYPNLVLRSKRYWLVKTIHVMMISVAYLVDLLNILTMKRRRYTKLVTQAVMVANILEFFTSNSWVLKSEKAEALFYTLSPTDARMFPCLASDISWKDYLPAYFQGVKKYLIEKKIM